MYQDGKAYHRWRAYGQSKTANILFSVELARRLGPKGIKAFSVHPGAIATNLGRYVNNDFSDLSASSIDTSGRDLMTDCHALRTGALDKELGNKQGDDGFQFFWKNLTQGTSTHIVAAFDPKLEGQCPPPRTHMISIATAMADMRT